MDDTMKVEKADIEDIDSLVELRLDYLIEDKASDKLLDDIYSEMFSGQNGRRLVLITADDDVTAFFRSRDVMMDSRAEYWYKSEDISI